MGRGDVALQTPRRDNTAGNVQLDEVSISRFECLEGSQDAILAQHLTHRAHFRPLRRAATFHELTYCTWQAWKPYSRYPAGSLSRVLGTLRLLY